MITTSFFGYPNDGRVRLVEQLSEQSGFYVCNDDPIYAELSTGAERRVLAETACLNLNLAAKLRLVNDEGADGDEETFNLIRLTSHDRQRELISFVELCEMHAKGSSSLSFEDFFYSLSELFQPNHEQSKLSAHGLFAELSLVDTWSSMLPGFDFTARWQVQGVRSKYDFSFSEKNVEVKATAAEDVDVLIKHAQLFNGDDNYLAVVLIEKSPSGESLLHLAERLKKSGNCFLSLKSRMELDRRMLQIRNEDMNTLISVREQRFYEASLINPFEDVPDRVTSLSYRLNLIDVEHLSADDVVQLVTS